jgi:hypothetical protein
MSEIANLKNSDKSSLAELIERLKQAGATPEVIDICLEFCVTSRHVTVQAASRDAETFRKKAAIRSKRYRDKLKSPSRDASRDGDVILSSSFLLSSIGKPLTSSVPLHKERVSVAGREVQKETDTNFELFYKKYPLHVGKRAAKKAHAAAVKRVEHPALMAGLGRYITNANPEFYCHPATWLNGDRWLDEPRGAAPQTNDAALELARRTEEYKAQLAARKANGHGNQNGTENQTEFLRRSANGSGKGSAHQKSEAVLQEGQSIHGEEQFAGDEMADDHF